MKKVSVAVFVILAFHVMLTACNAMGGANGRASTTIRVEMHEFSFEPKTIIVPAGQQITLELKNRGAILHDLTILKKGVVLPGKFDPDKQKDNMYFHATLDSGKADTFQFMAPAEPGEYQIVCGVAGHFQSGMIGTLMVVIP